MALPVLIIGESGTGKSASLRNFNEDEVVVINVAGKPLPFKNHIACFSTDDYKDIDRKLKNFVLQRYKSIVIDDAQYLMANEFMRRATERGFDKFTEIGQNFWILVNSIKELPNDIIVYFLSHIERDANGNEKIKTIGKLLDEKITVEGMFTIVLKTNVTDGSYSFITQNNGHDTVKSPMGMFPGMVIDNDLKYVDDKIRNYYEIGDFKSDTEMEKEDKTVKKNDVIKEEKKSRRGRKKKEEIPEETPEKKEITEEKPKRGRKKKSVNEELAEEREAVREENEQAIVNSNLSDEVDEIPLEEAEEPEIKEPPRRKRRSKIADVDTGTDTIEDAKSEEIMPEPVESSEEQEEKPARRRRRRV